MNTAVDYYEYVISEHFLSALINDDYSGLSDSDEKALTNWLESLDLPQGHWDIVEDSHNFSGCDITGLGALTQIIRWINMEPSWEDDISTDDGAIDAYKQFCDEYGISEPSEDDFNDRYRGHWDRFRDFVENYADECCDYDGLCKNYEFWSRYIDYDQMAYDFEIRGDYSIIELPERYGVFVFENNV